MSFEAPSSPSRRRSGRPPPRRQTGSFKGVRKRGGGRWVSEIRIPHSREKIWLGSYSMPELAARAYDTAYLLLRGPSASSSLNLSDSSHLITPYLAAYIKGHQAITRRTIQTVAAQIADALSGLETSLLCTKSRTSMAQLEAERGQESYTNGFSQTSTGEASLQDLVSAESRWIFDALNLHSPEENTNSSSVTASAAAPSRLQGGGGSLSCSAGLDQEQLMSAISLAVCDEFHQALHEALARDGFTPISCAVTTRERFDMDVASPDDALWTYQGHHR